MNLKYIFLIIGLLFSIVSKIMQFKFKMKAGDIVVIPAGVFFTLAILFSFKKYSDLFLHHNGTGKGIMIGFLACLTVVLFQIMMIKVAGNKEKNGIVLLIPLLISGGMFYCNWIKI